MILKMQYLHGDNAFRQYDEQFRKLNKNINFPWQIPVHELRLRLLHDTFFQLNFSKTSPFAQGSVTSIKR